VVYATLGEENMNLHKISFALLFLLTTGDQALALTSREIQLINHVEQSITHADQGISKLTGQILALPGMTSPKVKHFLNNICSLQHTSYLEIGVWKGATFISALYDNQPSIRQAVAIDNWSEFGGPAQEFKANCQSYLSRVPYKFYAEDAFAIDIKNLFNAPVDIYFYDGNHTAESQELAFTYYNDLFASSFIAIIDDWNYEPVRIGTERAFAHLGYTVLFEQKLPARFNGDVAQWWHGLYVAVIRKHK
jgi:hypothetical protein